MTPMPAGPPPGRRWRFARLWSAPHRLGFAAAALVMAGSAAWWAAVLAARHAGIALPWAVPPPVAHGLVMSLGFMPLFIAGFVFTAGPRWLGVPAVPATALRGPVGAMLAGWAAAMVGFHGHAAWAAAGLAAVALGWALLMRRFVRLLHASRAADKLHPTLVALCGAIGGVAMALAALGLAAGETTWVRAATRLALWGFLAPTFAVVSHRMLPFFSAGVPPVLETRWPNALPWLLLGALWLSAAGAIVDVGGRPWPALLRGAQAGAEALAALALLGLAVRWVRLQGLKPRLLGMLFGGFVWLGAALGLAALSHALMAASGDARSLGLAPLHALTMGYLGATLFAMATRVVAGHSGRAVAADDVAWALYGLLQAAALARVAAAAWPAAPPALTLAAAAGWLAATAGWALRYGGWLGRPRADGRPG